MRGPGRREIGHGALAERALLPLIPTEAAFPYTPGMLLLDFLDVPHGLSARELESYLREHGEEICHTAQLPAGARAEGTT